MAGTHPTQQEHYGSDRLCSNCMSDDERERLADLLFAMMVRDMF